MLHRIRTALFKYARSLFKGQWLRGHTYYFRWCQLPQAIFFIMLILILFGENWMANSISASKDIHKKRKNGMYNCTYIAMVLRSQWPRLSSDDPEVSTNYWALLTASGNIIRKTCFAKKRRRCWEVTYFEPLRISFFVRWPRKWRHTTMVIEGKVAAFSW